MRNQLPAPGSRPPAATCCALARGPPGHSKEITNVAHTPPRIGRYWHFTWENPQNSAENGGENDPSEFDAFPPTRSAGHAKSPPNTSISAMKGSVSGIRPGAPPARRRKPREGWKKPSAAKTAPRFCDPSNGFRRSRAADFSAREKGSFSKQKLTDIALKNFVSRRRGAEKLRNHL